MDHTLDRASHMVRVRMGLYIHLSTYAFINLILIGINLAASPHYYWFAWVLAGWGVGLLLHIGLIVGVPKLRALKARMINQEMKRGAES